MLGPGRSKLCPKSLNNVTKDDLEVAKYSLLHHWFRLMSCPHDKEWLINCFQSLKRRHFDFVLTVTFANCGSVALQAFINIQFYYVSGLKSIAKRTEWMTIP